MMNIEMNTLIDNAAKHWKYIAPVVHEPQNEDDYHRLSQLLDELLDRVGENESHPLIGLVDVIGHMIAMYDERESLMEHTYGVDALRFLMKQHRLRQVDLSDILSQGVLSEILNGKRKLNLNQINKLAKKFHVSVETFIDKED